MFEFFRSWGPQDIPPDKDSFERKLHKLQVKGEALMQKRRAEGPLCYSFALVQVICRNVGIENGLQLLGWDNVPQRDVYCSTMDIKNHPLLYTTRGRAEMRSLFE